MEELETSPEQPAVETDAATDTPAEQPAPEPDAAATHVPGEDAAEASPTSEDAAASEVANVPGADAAETEELSHDAAAEVPGEESELSAETPADHLAITMEELLARAEPEKVSLEDAQLRAVIEAIVYVAEEPLTLAQLSAALHETPERVQSVLQQVIAEFEKPEHGVTVREVAGGYKMATKAEHHDAVRSFVKSLKPPLKLSLPALETLAVIAYKQPVTGPEIMEIRGVQGAGVLKTLLDRKLIAVAGRKNVIGKPMLYKTTKEFLIQFGLKDLSELPSLKEFEEIRRMAFSDDTPPAEPEVQPDPAPEESPS
jgi:segregation and condensation protein B